MLAFLPLTALDLVLFVLPMLVMGIASVLVIREFHVEYRLTANNYLFFLGNPLYLTLLIRSVLIAVAVTVDLPDTGLPVRVSPDAAAQANAAHDDSAGDPAVLDQLSAARLCVDDDPGRARADQSDADGRWHSR